MEDCLRRTGGVEVSIGGTRAYIACMGSGYRIRAAGGNVVDVDSAALGYLPRVS